MRRPHVLRLLVLVCLASAWPALGYMPTDQPGPHHVTALDQTWTDRKRSARQVPVRIYLPARADRSCPVIIFSHGLGGSREYYGYVGEFWASHGYASVHIQHAGSDDGVWKGRAAGDAMAAVRRAASSPTIAINRARDVSFAIDTLETLNTDHTSELHRRLDMRRLGVAGHSYGAWTTLVIGGQAVSTPGAGRVELADDRVTALMPMSAPVPRGKRRRAKSYAPIKTPALHMTGTLDESPLNTTSAEERRIPFDMSPGPDEGGADVYLINFDGADHATFSGEGRRQGRDRAVVRKDPVFQAHIKRAGLAFWDAYLRGDPDAKAYLQGGGLAEAVGDAGVVEIKK